MNPGTLLRFPLYSELQVCVACKYSCSNFGTFYIVGGRRLLTTESLSWKDTISSRSELSTCVLSKHIGRKGHQLPAQMKLTQLTNNILCVGWRVESMIEGSYFQKTKSHYCPCW